MSFSLSKGSLKKILDGENINEPIMQIINVKSIQNNNVDQQTRYKLTLYDGEMQHTFGILATQQNHLVETDQLHASSVVKLSEYAANVLSKDPPKVVIILMNFDILGDMEIKLNDTKAANKLNNENQEPIKTNSYNSNTNKISPNKPSANNNSNTSTNANNSNSSNAGINSNKFFKQDSLKQPKKAILDNTNTSSSLSSSQNGSTSFCGFKVFSISSLNPYQNKWAIKARVTNKSAIRTWNNSKGEGRLFSVDFIDHSGEIRATGFNDAVDKYYDLLQVDHVYYITKAQLKTANKQYTTIDNDYEMSFANETVIEQCNSDDSDNNSIPHIKIQLIPLSDILNKNANDLVDVIGIAKNSSDLQTIIAKQTNRELKKREVQLIDSSKCSVTCTLWGKQAEDFDAKDNPVLLLKGAKVSEFNGKQLSILGSTTIQINPDISEAHTLRGWFDQGGADNIDIHDISSNPNGGAGGSGMMTQSNWKSLDQVKDEQLGMNDKADYFSSVATILLAKKDNSLYMACPSENCNKKVIDQNNGFFRCEKCGKDFDTFKWRMILNLNIGDHTESQWVTCFQDTAESILDIKAQDLGELKSSDERKVKISVVNAEPVDYVASGKRLLSKIKSFIASN